MPRLGDEAGAAGFSLVTLETVDSTNRLALDLAEQAGANKTWVLAETQRAGRGRHGRDWVSPPGNFYGSLLLVSPCPVEDSPKLGFVAGVAVAEVLKKLAPGHNVCLKWPNDILVGGRKLAGILLEGRIISKSRQAIAIGIGINVRVAPLAAGAAVSLAELGVTADRREIFRQLSNVMTRWIATFAKGQGFYAVRQAWADHGLKPGTAISVKLPSGEKQGRFAGIDERGRLILSGPEGQTTIEAGDVFLTAEEH
jgi:BirA family biotin operon repressor/biotin-[acetyl-CoA-carboxylase] ligase